MDVVLDAWISSSPPRHPHIANTGSCFFFFIIFIIHLLIVTDAYSCLALLCLILPEPVHLSPGLKHVSDDKKTHKNPALRTQGSAPVRTGPQPFTSSRPAAPAAPTRTLPPVLELDGKKWKVVRYLVTFSFPGEKYCMTFLFIKAPIIWLMELKPVNNKTSPKMSTQVFWCKHCLPGLAHDVVILLGRKLHQLHQLHLNVHSNKPKLERKGVEDAASPPN